MKVNKTSWITTLIPWTYSPRSKSVQILIWLTFIISAIGIGSAVKCYQCKVAEELLRVNGSYITTPMCSKLKESNNSVKECPYSTMCLKTIFSFQLPNGQIHNAVTKGCAQQRNNTQVLIKRQWEFHDFVEEVYEEGCKEYEDNEFTIPIKTYCYCRGDLCNSARSESALINKVMAVIVSLASLLFEL